jgi:serine/threonine-protein kinase
VVASSPLEPGQVVAGRYRVESRLGEGGMGAVYLVRHIHTDESLALKVLHAHVLKDESAVERFRREARAPARIANEHVARVTDADTAPDLDGAPFYVMELLRGRDLERILVEDGPISPVLLVEYLSQAARALDKAHAMGIVHRDLKPENLFVTERDDGSPCVKLLDFGIARLWEADAPGQMKTEAGFVFGTPAFLSPEQAMGNIDAVGPPTDVWAIGLLTFKLLVGHEFWGSKNLAHLYAMILSEPIPAASTKGSTFGPAFDAWLLRCLERKGADRFQSVGEAVASLGEALGVRLAIQRRSSASLVAAEPFTAQGGAAQTRQSIPDVPDAAAVASLPVAESVPPPPRKKPLVAIGVAVLCLALVAGVIGVVLGIRQKSNGLVASTSASATALPPVGSASVASTSSTPEPPTTIIATPLAVAEEPHAPAPREGSRTGAAKAAEAAASGKSSAPSAVLTRDQRRRLETLQRLCDQGTFTPPECKTKRIAIMHGDP